MIHYVTKLVVIIVCLVTSLIWCPTITEESEATMESYSRYISRPFIPPLQVSKQDTLCLAQAIYYEAANQSELGKEAVALVITNRVYSKKYPKTICGVVRQSHLVNEKRICQFSYWCDDELRKPIQDVWVQSKEIAKRVLTNYWQRELISTPMHRALYYHADYVNPKWRTEKVYIGKVGNHLFYTDRQNLT